MAWTDLAKHLNLTAKATQDLWNKTKLDGDEVTSLASVFALPVDLPPDGSISTAKIESGLAKLAPPKPAPRKKKSKGGGS